jgi:hypothetical protein
MARRMEERRLDIRRTSRKDYCVQRARQILQFRGREAERKFDWFGAVLCDGCHVLVVGIAFIAKFFFSSAIGDPYANFWGWRRGHELPSYHCAAGAAIFCS